MDKIYTRAEQTEILKITLGEPTKLSSLAYQNTSVLMVSRTGVVAAFYPKPGTRPAFYRISTDSGLTWSQEMDSPPELGGGQNSGTLRDGGVIMPASIVDSSTEGEEYCFDTLFLRFTDDMMNWETEIAQVYVPIVAPGLDVRDLTFAKGKMLQLPNGDVLAPVYGRFEGDIQHRAYLIRSDDQGHTWRYYATIAYDSDDPNPELPGQYLGSCEPSIALLPNGQMLAMLRAQYSHVPAEYKPMYVCWSDDQGKTWTEPVPTNPHLMNISPTLQVLDNGVVACEYGRPGFHVAFSTDNGHTWGNRISFTHLIEPSNTGQFDMIKVGPNKLVAIGSDEDGTKVFPITVERVQVSPARAVLTGRALDEQDNPIVGAKVERSPNRYAADSWAVDPVGWSKRVTFPNDHPTRMVLAEYIPELGYRSIQKGSGFPTVETDTQGKFRFEAVKLGELVLTVEAEDYAPEHRHIRVGPQAESQDFSLKAGRAVRGQVVDEQDRAIGGVCVEIDQWHCHTDQYGFFHRAVEAPVPRDVEIEVYKRYSSEYEPFKGTVSLSRIGQQPITLKKK